MTGNDDSNGILSASLAHQLGGNFQLCGHIAVGKGAAIRNCEHFTPDTLGEVATVSLQWQVESPEITRDICVELTRCVTQQRGGGGLAGLGALPVKPRDDTSFAPGVDHDHCDCD